ncbi:MAG: UbiD family decarboxylase [Candidatus Diapherotrites archaeon]|nr:UbiD family decarboxylase [Candidatus Diapherotrites archaeon]
MDLRTLMQTLEAEGKLARITKEVCAVYETANVINALNEQPVLFENVRGSRYSVLAGIVSSRELIAEGLGTTKEKLLHKLVEALRKPKDYEVVSKAPCQEVVEKDVDLTELPILTHLDGDGGAYATASVGVLEDLQTGRNLDYHRMMLLGKNRLSVRLVANRQMRNTYDKTDADLPVAFAIGNSTAVLVAASLGPPSGVDELRIANALDETNAVKCMTNDLFVPADAEIILEGRLTKELDREGPFVDLTETRDFERREPVFVVDCITHRKDAMYQALLPGKLEHKILMGMPKEPTIYDEVSRVCDCRNVLVTPGGGSWLHCVVKIRKREDDDGKKAIEAAFRGHGSLKHCVVVDEDVDVYDPNAVEWAIATRFQADKDLVITRSSGSSLDPSADHSGKKSLTAKAGLDATKPGNVDPKAYEKVGYKEVSIGEYV